MLLGAAVETLLSTTVDAGDAGGGGEGGDAGTRPPGSGGSLVGL